jgi:hypothetical protein
MTRASWTAAPFVVHLAGDGSVAVELERQARDDGASVIRLNLADAQDRAALGDLLARSFLFPHETSGLDAAVDLISDLEWLGNACGYLVITEMLGAPNEVVTAWAEILPAIIDRWRSQGRPFAAVLVDGEAVGIARAALSQANRRLEHAGQLAWAQAGTGPVEILDHIADTDA